LNWTGLKKKLTSPIELKRQWIEPKYEAISIRRQCELLGLNRSTLYYQPIPVSDEELQVMRLIDEPCLLQVDTDALI
jgi:putative transposase